jgi:hypothetical protein
MEHASVTVQLSVEDINALTRHFEKENSRLISKFLPAAWWMFSLKRRLALSFFLVLLFGFEVFFDSSPHPLFPWLPTFRAFVFGFMPMGFMFELAKLRARSEAHLRKTRPSLFLPNAYRVLDEGFSLENDRETILTRWSALEGVLESKTHFWVMLNKVHGYVFPKRCFSFPEAAAHFAEQVGLQIAKSKNAAGAVAKPPCAADSAASGWVLPAKAPAGS